MLIPNTLTEVKPYLMLQLLARCLTCDTHKLRALYQTVGHAVGS